MAGKNQQTHVLVGMHAGVCRVACGADGSARIVSDVTRLEHAAARLAVCASRPQIVYLAAYEAGLWRSDDGGVAWRRVEAYPVEHAHSIAVHPLDPNRLYVGSEPAATFRSSDGGIRWSECESFRKRPEAKEWYFFEPRQPHVRAFAMAPDDPARLYAGIEVGGIYRSIDAGGEWSLLEGPYPDIHTLSVTPARPQTLYAGTASSPYRSDDGGDTWSEIGQGLPYTYIVPITPAPDDHHLVLVGCATGPQREISRLMRSTDGGKTWQETEWPGPDTDMAVAIAWDQADLNVVYAGTDKGKLYRSADRGTSWRELPVSVQSVAVGSLTVMPR